MRPIHNIVIHCSASPNGDPKVDRDVIDAWHRAGNPKIGKKPWRMIGYHYVIEVDGRVAIGRPEDMVGAHVAGENASSIGVCMVGTDRFSLAQWESLRDLVEDLTERHRGASVWGHRDFSPDQDGDGVIEPWEWFKLCPGFQVDAWRLSGMDPYWDVKHLYAPPAAAQAGFGVVQAVAAVAIAGALTALFFGAKTYIDGVRAEALDAGRRAALLEVAERDNKQLQAVQARVLELQAELEAKEASHRAEVARIDQEGTHELRKVELQRDAARRAARDYAGQLRDPGRAEAVACPPGGGAGPAATTVAGAGVGDGSGGTGGAELSRAAAEFLQSEAARADEVVFKLNRTIVQLEACQKILVDDRRT